MGQHLECQEGAESTEENVMLSEGDSTSAAGWLARLRSNDNCPMQLVIAPGHSQTFVSYTKKLTSTTSNTFHTRRTMLWCGGHAVPGLCAGQPGADPTKKHLLTFVSQKLQRQPPTTSADFVNWRMAPRSTRPTQATITINASDEGHRQTPEQ